MAIIRDPLPVKLFIGMLAPDIDLFDVCAEILRKEYGPLDYQSAVMPWDKTHYYQDEMGSGIFRKFIFFDHLVNPGDLPEIKHFTTKMEQRFAIRADAVVRRRINLDPGYVTEAKVVLATTKDFAHRIYIGSNMYAEVTLKYAVRDREFTPLEYTYPDYRTDAYRTMFKEARDRLRAAFHDPHRKQQFNNKN
jgi:Domain of unknown function (DUF4416)